MKIKVMPSVAEGKVRAPRSKSWAQRALFLSLLSKRSEIREIPDSKDVLASLNAIKMFGAKVNGEVIEGGLKVPEDVINMGGSGTGARIAIGIGTLLPKGFGACITGDETLRRRTMKPVIDTFNSLEGAEVRSLRGDKLPVVAFGKLKGGKAVVDGSVSSQHITSALIAGLKSEDGVELEIKRPVSRAYIELTEMVIKQFGGKVKCNESFTWCKSEPSEMEGIEGRVPGDYALSAFIMAFGYKGCVEIYDLPEREGKYGDHKIIDYMRQAGLNVEYEDGRVRVCGGALKPFTVNLRDQPDLVLPMVALAAMAKGESTIIGVRHLIHKESNRVEEIIKLLKCFGVTANTDGVSIKIWGGSLRPCNYVCPKDHRMAMTWSILASEVGGELYGAECVDKSWPQYWEVLKKLGIRLLHS